MRWIISIGIILAIAMVIPCAAHAKIVAISTTGGHLLALNDDNTVYAWGSNNHGETATGKLKPLFNGSSIMIGDPRFVDTPCKVPIDNATAISTYIGVSLVLRSDGTVWAWGDNTFGQLGIGNHETQIAPVQVRNLTNVTAIVAGNTCYALEDDGTVYAWGYNERDDIDDTGMDYLTPVQVTGLMDIKAISPNYAIKGDGTVWAWGDNTYEVFDNGTAIYGALGNSSAIRAVHPPSPVEGVTDVKQITDPDPTLYIKNDGTVWAWGSRQYGGLGDGNATSYYEESFAAPSVQAKIDDVAQISHDGTQAIALKNDGTVWVWGGSTYAKETSIKEWSTPMKIEGLDHVVQICSGAGCDFALKDDGSIWGWGWDDDSMLRGLGNKIQGELNPNASKASSPIMVWKGPSQDAQNDTGASGTTRASVPSPGLDFDTIVVLVCLLTITSFVFRSTENRR